MSTDGGAMMNDGLLWSKSLWAIKFVSENRLDGRQENVLIDSEVDTRLPRLFRTRSAARSFVRDAYGYIAKRPDLRAEPHGWKMPQVVRVSLQITEAVEAP